MNRREVALFTLADSERRILMQHRTDDAPVLPGYWGFFGGGVEPGETPRQAVVREAYEELRIDLPPVELVGCFNARVADHDVEFHLYLGRLQESVADLEQQQGEGQGLGVFDRRELGYLTIAEHDWVHLDAVFDRLGDTRPEQLSQ